MWEWRLSVLMFICWDEVGMWEQVNKRDQVALSVAQPCKGVCEGFQTFVQLSASSRLKEAAFHILGLFRD